MGVGIRYFVVDDHDNVMTLSKQRVTDIFDGRRGEPEWAGKTIRYLQVIVTVENRRVVKVHDVQGLRLTLDAEGRHSEEAQTAAMRAAVNAVDFGLPDPHVHGPNVADARGCSRSGRTLPNTTGSRAARSCWRSGGSCWDERWGWRRGRARRRRHRRIPRSALIHLCAR
jgi:hypothetical protein